MSPFDVGSRSTHLTTTHIRQQASSVKTNPNSSAEELYKYHPSKFVKVAMANYVLIRLYRARSMFDLYNEVGICERYVLYYSKCIILFVLIREHAQQSLSLSLQTRFSVKLTLKFISSIKVSRSL